MAIALSLRSRRRRRWRGDSLFVAVALLPVMLDVRAHGVHVIDECLHQRDRCGLCLRHRDEDKRLASFCTAALPVATRDNDDG